MKIAVFFPGIGYHCDKPLLYYARKLVQEYGYEKIVMQEYSYNGKNIRGDKKKMQEAFECLYAQAEKKLEEIRNDDHILLVTGIASPAAIISKLSAYTQFVTPSTFPDHHDFDATDMKRIEDAFRKLPEGKRFIITTEKDAARLIAHPLLSETMKPYIYVLPVEVEFLNKEEHLFNQNIIEYVRKNSRNSSFSKS